MINSYFTKIKKLTIRVLAISASTLTIVALLREEFQAGMILFFSWLLIVIAEKRIFPHNTWMLKSGLFSCFVAKSRKDFPIQWINSCFPLLLQFFLYRLSLKLRVFGWFYTVQDQLKRLKWKIYLNAKNKEKSGKKALDCLEYLQKACYGHVLRENNFSYHYWLLTIMTL